MLNLQRMHHIRLSSHPTLQLWIAQTLLAYNYQWDPGIEIVIENIERIPSTPVIFAMNHTDRFNCIPFQYQWMRVRQRFTATWVKGKYYEHPVLAALLQSLNNIPTISKGYLIARDFRATLHRLPQEREYETLRAWIDQKISAPEASPHLPSLLLSQPRDILGVAFDPAQQDYAHTIRDLQNQMMRAFTALNRQALAIGLDLVIFPEGTRSVRLSKGHTGLAQIALTSPQCHVVPIGCNNCDLIYPGSSPKARKGTVVYRVGQPLSFQDLAPWHLPADFEPFLPDHEERHRPTLQAMVDHVMDRIAGLLDERHQPHADHHSDGVQGARRFL